MITVFTPTYNRAYCLGRLYDSLKKQTSKNFEWIVINDGSTDNTNELFKNWLREDNGFHIIYKEVPNGGKHKAINEAVRMASTEAFFIVDSDDWLLENAVEKSDKWFEKIAEDDSFAGVSGLKGYSCGRPIGGEPSFEGEFVDCTNLERGLYNLGGDKAEIYKTSLLKEYPFPEFKNENYMNLGYVWNEIARDGYKIRWYNEIIYLGEYLQDGLSANIIKKAVTNPKGYLTWIELLETIYRKEEVDIVRFEYYRHIIEELGNERALEIVYMANEMKKSSS